MTPSKILIVVGTRPNFIKVTQFEKEFAAYGDRFSYRLLHTGQHYDHAMSEVFFKQLGLRQPDYHLGAQGDTPAAVIGDIIVKLSAVLQEWRPDLLIVVGDVNSTLAAAICANKLGIKLAHLESGLRSRDRSMPEEINRILTDEIADYCFVTEQSGLDNLLAEGKDPESLFFVGNTMIDTLVAFEPHIEGSQVFEQIGLTPEAPYVLMTIHRPSNVDTPEGLEKLLRLVETVAQDYKVVFPIHPRTKQRLESFGLMERLVALPAVLLCPPLDYLGFQKLISHCAFVLTDSGGIQEETTYRKVPCLTLRPNTERPSTVTLGSNLLLPFDLQTIEDILQTLKARTFKVDRKVPPLWDGQATKRTVEAIAAITAIGK